MRKRCGATKSGVTETSRPSELEVVLRDGDFRNGAGGSLRQVIRKGNGGLVGGETCVKPGIQRVLLSDTETRFVS